MPSLPVYELRILPALRAIQDRHGYLRREELEAFARGSGVPLHRLQAVASFFPHFRLAPPPAVTLRVCRDMACHMAGGGRIAAEVAAAVGNKVVVEGVSCLGRCDRAPAACVSINRAGSAAVHANGHDHLYLGRSASALRSIVERCAAAAAGDGGPPAADTDAALAPTGPAWRIDPYARAADDGTAPPPPYAAARAVAAARLAAIARAADALHENHGWPRDRAELFGVAAARRLAVDFPIDDPLREAVRQWQTDADWAKGETLGGWSEAFLRELDEAAADLRGMGGAGIPAAQKWRDVRDAVRAARRRRQDDRAFVVVNADESEPGTFKDRELLLRAAHLVVEAAIVAALLTEATEAFVYVRHEYAEQVDACERAIRAAEDAGVCGPVAPAAGRPLRVSVFVSPGGYVCGEQSALVEAISDRRAEPRNMPPKLETNGLDDRPTLVSNVETFAWVPFILLRGGAAYAAMGTNACRGRRFFSVSGDVVRPGVYEVPMGTTLRELVCGPDYAGGVVGGRPLKAVAPSGPSGGFLPARLTAAAGLPRDHAANRAWRELAARRGFDPGAEGLDVLDLELELNVFRALSPTQALGAGIVVYAEGRDMVDQAVNAVEFFRNESCGKCVPCRIGSRKLAALGENVLAGRVSAERWEAELGPAAAELGRAMEQTSICGLGRSVPVPLRTVADYFPDDLAARLTAQREARP